MWGLMIAHRMSRMARLRNGSSIAGDSHIGCGGVWPGGLWRGLGVRIIQSEANSAKPFCVGPPPSSMSYSRWPVASPFEKLVTLHRAELLPFLVRKMAYDGFLVLTA